METNQTADINDIVECFPWFLYCCSPGFVAIYHAYKEMYIFTVDVYFQAVTMFGNFLEIYSYTIEIEQIPSPTGNSHSERLRTIPSGTKIIIAEINKTTKEAA